MLSNKKMPAFDTNSNGELIILSAADETYARTLAQFLLSVKRHFPGAEVVIFDLGIDAANLELLKKRFPQTRFKGFDIKKYPPHFSLLYTCAWKPAIIDEWVRHRKQVLWLDAATIVRSPQLFVAAKQHLANKGYFGLTSQSPISAWCHPSTLARMAAPPEILTDLIVPAGVLGFDGENPEIRKLVSAWKNACLSSGVISPEGATRKNHRFDQSVLNILLYTKIRQNLLIPPSGGEIDISSISPVHYLSTRNFVANHYPLWCDSILRFKHRIVKATDRFILKLRHIHKTTLSGFHRLAQENFSIIVETGAGKRILKSPVNQYWADPFVLEKGNRIWLLFEKYEATKAKGVISALAVNDNGKIVERERTVLSERWHLSYPHIWQSGKRTFMLPESSAAGTVDLYEALDFPNTWVLRTRLLYGIDAADTTLLRAQGRYWLFCAVRVSPGSPGRALHIYSSKSLLGGKWLPHPINAENRYADLPFSSGRGAGRIFRADRVWIRPMQWSRNYYGQGMRFMKIQQLSLTCYKETATNIPQWNRFLDAHHVDFARRALVFDHRVRSGLFRRTRRWVD